MYVQITIDGPGGVGKSSLTKALAKALGFLSVNTGLIFRGLAWYFLKNATEREKIAEALDTLLRDRSFYFSDNRWFLGTEQVPENELTNPRIARFASQIASYPEVRQFAMAIEKEVAKNKNIVMEGRDIGTAIFPDAILKIYLTASIETRSQRRYLELKEKNLLAEGQSLETIRDEILRRDQEDENRPVSPLRKPKDALVIQNDNRTIDQLVEEIKVELETRLRALRAAQR